MVEVTDVMRDGHISLPNGLGLGRNGDGSDAVGVAPNELTASDDRDWFAGTPLHKHVRARVEPWWPSRCSLREAHPLRRLAVPDRPHDRPDR